MAKKAAVDMTVDELDKEIVALKRQQIAIRDKKAELAAIRKEKVREERLTDRIKAAGLEGVVVVPGTAHLGTKGRR